MSKLPFLTDSLFNRPIALSSRKAETIVAALAGKLDIASLMTETRQFDRVALEALADRGRAEHRFELEARARRNKVPDGPMMCSDWYGDKPYPISANGIAIIEIAGTLTRAWGTNPYSGSTGYDGIFTKLAFAMDDDDCKAIWLKINSGGGAVDGLFDLCDAIYKCREKSGGKPIWAFAGDYAYSAAYALGSAADKFYAPDLGGVGSVSAIAIFVDYTGAMEQDGIKAEIFRGAPRKAIGVGGLESLDDTERAHIQEQIEEAGTYFVERVALYRGIAKSRVSETQGTDYTATKARAIGFIDGIMSEQDAWAKLGRSLAR